MPTNEQSAEEWRAIPGYEGSYEVSDQGRVRSVDRDVTYADGRIRRYQGQMLKPAKTVYWAVALSGKSELVHQLVLAAFVGPKPPGHVARHLDDNKDDNRLINLAYGTYGDNQNDTLRNGHNVQANKTHCPQGHPYDGDNLMISKRGSRLCRECNRVASKARWASGANKSECPVCGKLRDHMKRHIASMHPEVADDYIQ